MIRSDFVAVPLYERRREIYKAVVLRVPTIGPSQILMDLYLY